MVLTSIHGRSEARTYAKNIAAWSCDQAMSPEEEEAVGLRQGGLTAAASDGLLDRQQPVPARPVLADVEGAGGRVDRDRRQGAVPEHRVGVGDAGAGTRRRRRGGGSSRRRRPARSAASGSAKARRGGGRGAARC